MLAITFWALGILIACAGYEKLNSSISVVIPSGRLIIVNEIPGPPVGLAHRDKDGTYRITVEGYRYRGKIALDRPWVLGHEIWHWLAWKYPKLFWNPDELIGEIY